MIPFQQPVDMPKRKTLRLRSSGNRSGQGMVEHVLILALVSVGLILVLLVFRNQIVSGMDGATQSLQSTSGISPYVPGGGPAAGAAGSGGSAAGSNGNGNGRGRGRSGAT